MTMKLNLEKYVSRKFLLAVFAAVNVIGMGYKELLPWDQVASSLTLIVAAYIGGEAIPDLGGALGNALRKGGSGLLALCLIAGLATGCATTQKTDFEQYSETGAIEMSYQNRIFIPPWGKADAVSGDMGAMIDIDGAWKLDVGQSAKGLDNSGQIKALKESMEGLIGVLQMGVQGVATYYGGRAQLATVEGSSDDDFERLKNCPVLDTDGDGVANGPDADWVDPEVQ